MRVDRAALRALLFDHAAVIRALNDNGVETTEDEGPPSPPELKRPAWRELKPDYMDGEQ